MPRKKETITLSIPPGTKEKLEKIARSLKIFWGKSPSISGLLVAIAEESVDIRKPFELDSNQVNALSQSIKALNDAGHVGEAQTVLALLLEKGSLEAPMRQSLMKQIGKSVPAWRIQVEDFIKKKQSFYLLYQNSQSDELEYTVRYAEVKFFDKRFYLLIWCEETQDVENDIPDLPELWHNRCLRFDRIKSVLPINGNWRGKLDYIKVQLHFRGWLKKAYTPKEDDLEDEIIGDVRQIERKVVNHFWLIREVSRYGKDCIIVSPDEVRSRFRENLKSLCQAYDLDVM